MRFLFLFLMISVATATPHPRLLLTPEMNAAIKARIKNDPLAADIHKVVVQRANQILEERTSQHLIPDGKRLLAESRRALKNVLYCGMAWRTTGEARFRERVIQELEAAVTLKDWNPSHFLDTSEMATAVSLGYDWLYPTLSAGQRTRYEDALIKMALTCVTIKYGKNPWWFRYAKSNWSQVCSGGLLLAADTIKERNPELATRILTEASRMIQECEKLYQPHGGYPEGPGYWHYGTNYHVIGLAASKTMGQAIPVPPILERSGDFILQLNGPTGYNFNFADGQAARKLPTPAQSWIAHTFQNTNQATLIRQQLTDRFKEARENPARPLKPGGYFPLHLLWLPAPTKPTSIPVLADLFGGKQPIAMARTGWSSDDAWLAIKGGTGAASHGHLDVGSFVYEAGGVRWFRDLGSDNYNLPGYFHGDRWQYLRLQNHSHNTLVIDNKIQGTPATGCPLTPWTKKDDLLTTQGNLTSAYAGQAKRVIRNASFSSQNGEVFIKDEIDQAIGSVRWALVTRADIEIKGDTVILTDKGKRLIVKRLDQSGGSWEEFSLKPKTTDEHQNPGRRIFGFLADPSENLTLEVSWKLEN